MFIRIRFLAVFAATALLALAPTAASPNQSAGTRMGNHAGQAARPLRYHPDGTDFVIENGAEFFNRPLYGNNTSFRVDGGDKPEFSLYLPGRGGNLRFGLKTGAGQKWLTSARNVVTRYRPGSLLYEIRDPLLGTGTLVLTVRMRSGTEGVMVRAERRGGASSPLQLIWTYGGANGERGARNGDIGTEKVPISRYFQFKPEFAAGNRFTIRNNTFTLQSKAGMVAGFLPPGATLAVADARQWDSPGDLLVSAGGAEQALPVLVGQAALVPSSPLYLSLERMTTGESAPPAPSADEITRQFEAAERRRQAIAERVIVDTPDPYLNAAASALCVAADGVWDEKQGAFMHGAVAWRTRLLGWRGAYSGDALGWHEHTRRHLLNWFPKQNVALAPGAASAEPARVGQDTSVRLARNEPMLHSSGDLTNSHYDMNLPAIDVLFRHLLWTGDLSFAREQWPVIERHLAWERRLFRRPFGPGKLPLYEAYAAIWASDDLQYEGGGVAHASAYNYYHNKMAARIARLLHKDATPYEREANLIAAAMRRELWLTDRGWFAEWKDLLGAQRRHPNAALWTLYHTIDSEVPDAREAWQMTRFVDTQVPHIPLEGPGVPKGDFFTLPTTTWMPYTWSTNNVVMAESAHTALAYYQAGRSDVAYSLFKGCLLDSMYLGLCPGNAGMTTYFDLARGESQRDFADAVGTTSRTLIEGLFGIRPDALSGTLRIRPGFPANWNRASLRHPDFQLSFQRSGVTETYIVESHFPRPLALSLQVVALRDQVAGVTVNGSPALWHPVNDAVGTPRIEIRGSAARCQVIVIRWKGEPPATAFAPAIAAYGSEVPAQFGTSQVREVSDPQHTLRGLRLTAHSFRAVAVGQLGARTVFARVHQGSLDWWQPLAFDLRPAGEIIASEHQDTDHLRFRLRNNTPTAIDREVALSIDGRKETVHLQAPAFGESSEFVADAAGLLPGSNRVTVSIGGNLTASGVVTNWNLKAAAQPWDHVDLTPLFNDRVARIFQNQYLSPRSPYTSLAIPTQGIGSWIHWNAAYDVDDGGLRRASDQNGGSLRTPLGIAFQTPGVSGDAPNIAFTSQWRNFPAQITLPLRGKSSHAYLLMAGSTNSMQSRFDNGEVIVTYTDGGTERLALENPTTWWPLDQDYVLDDFAFRDSAALPPRVLLKTGEILVRDLAAFKGKSGKITGGAATILDLPLDPNKELKSLTVRTLANEVVIGLMAVTLARDRRLDNKRPDMLR